MSIRLSPNTYIENILSDSCHFYEIEMNVIGPHPIFIVDKIFENFNSPNIKELINIYWEPKSTWFYTEYLGTEMEIVREIPQEEINKICSKGPKRISYKNNFNDDYCKAKSCADKVCNAI